MEVKREGGVLCPTLPHTPSLSPVTVPTQSFFNPKHSVGFWGPAAAGCWRLEGPQRRPQPLPSRTILIDGKVLSQRLINESVRRRVQA